MLHDDVADIGKHGIILGNKLPYFFICYLLSLGQFLGHCQGGSLTNLMLITAFTYINTVGHREPCNKVGPKDQPST